MGRPHELKAAVASIELMALQSHELLIIDNSTNPQDKAAWASFIRDFLKPKNLRYIPNEDNSGMVGTLNQIYKEATGDIVSILHSDLFIYTFGWDKLVLNEFGKDSTLGLVGFFGQQGMTENGGRLNTFSNMVEAEIHGARYTIPQYCITVDGFSIIYRKEMMDAVGGFDSDYLHHHFYDKSIGMDCYNAGYKAKMVPVVCHHWSGQTANHGEYQDWISKKMGVDSGGDKITFDQNMQTFNRKWLHCLPVWVDAQGNPNRPITKNLDI
jgi:glycosyltransferase involved in cell wall biosynthesis